MKMFTKKISAIILASVVAISMSGCLFLGSPSSSIKKVARDNHDIAVDILDECGLDADDLYEAETTGYKWRDNSGYTLYYVFSEDKDFEGMGYCVTVITDGNTDEHCHVGVGWDGYDNYTKFDSNAQLTAGNLKGEPSNDYNSGLEAINDREPYAEFFFDYDDEDIDFLGYQRYDTGREPIEAYYHTWSRPCHIEENGHTWFEDETGICSRFN